MVASAVGLTVIVPVVLPAGITSGEAIAAKSVPLAAVPLSAKFTDSAEDDAWFSVTVYTRFGAPSSATAAGETAMVALGTSSLRMVPVALAGAPTL